MELRRVLQGVDLFEGLRDDELDKVAEICSEKRYRPGELIAHEGEIGDEMFIIAEGFVEVLLGERPSASARVVVSLGSGQIIGEMALLDQGPRSASVRATSEPTIVQVIQRKDFERLCHDNTNIGYIVMHNLAADLSFKLRHRNLNER
ncbi:MAG: cyclic nucleotide-binding domain-containing protein [Anaerolineales bacterium]|nr:cyclic nucleotide-binding domain-containing protein [Anaerolineales bacterium]